MLAWLSGASCQYEDVPASNDLKGTWEWFRSCGGVVGCVHAANSPEMVHKKIIGMATIQTVANNGESTTVDYTIEKVKLQENARVFEIMTGDGQKYTMTVKNDTLVASVPELPVLASLYKRIK